MAAATDAEGTRSPGEPRNLHARGWGDVGTGPHLAGEEGVDRLANHLVASDAASLRRTVEAIDVGGPERDLAPH